ncbi:MAG: hypothetical protein HRU38_21750 [Saccharospirillaceae bacterium]|nr:hypothetical protein [Pseudomonadales bacterium]NRB81255.1 hypothetical protein [Saccharospirillaceae bacterium]
MKIKSRNQLLAVFGLTLGLLGIIYGLFVSSAIDVTPALIGIVSAVYCAVSASIISRMSSAANNK